MGKFDGEINVSENNMDLFVNELSIQKEVIESFSFVTNLYEMRQFLKNYGITTCRLSSEDYSYIINILKSDSAKRNLVNFIFSFFKAPYEGYEKLNNDPDEYLKHTWLCGESTCFGLALSYIYDSVCISFDDKWKELVTIKRDDCKIDVKNASNLLHLQYHIQWFESLQDVLLIETDIEIGNKEISLRDDHGKDELYKFSKKICGSPYVIGVINSLPYNSKEKRFIRRVKDNGIIECVLNWTDEGFGLVIQTTGRNYQETKKIAELLEDKYI